MPMKFLKRHPFPVLARFDRVVAEQSQENAFLYGLLAVALSVFMGWAAGRLFALV